MMKRAIYSMVGAGILLLPLIAGAQIDIPSTETTYQNAFSSIRNIINFAIPVIFALGLIVFLWGLLKFLTAAGKEDAAADGKRLMIWGVVILFVMTAVWGLVGIVGQFTGVNQGTTPNLPNVPVAR
jgi:hypothetical protein